MSRRSITTLVYPSQGARIRGCRSCSTAGSRRSRRRASIWRSVDGVMMGRAAYQEPWRLLAVDPLLFGEPAPFASPKAAAQALIPYIERELARGTRLHAITRHLLGLFQRVPGARAFRRHLATQAVKPGACAEVLAEALAWCWTGQPNWRNRRGMIACACRGPALFGERHGAGGLARRNCAARRRGHGRGRRHRHSRRPVRHRRRRHHRAGALRDVPHARRARGGAHAALRRHLDGDHRPDQRSAPISPIAPRARCSTTSCGSGRCRRWSASRSAR